MSWKQNLLKSLASDSLAETTMIFACGFKKRHHRTNATVIHDLPYAAERFNDLALRPVLEPLADVTLNGVGSGSCRNAQT
jgi:hypothetical protein